MPTNHRSFDHKPILLLLIWMFFAFRAAATDVRGVVWSQADDEPVIGATVRVNGSNQATSTDAEGRFALTVPDDAVSVTVTYVGLLPATVAIAPEMHIIMTADEKLLDEIVVTGYGTTRKAAFTGAASIVDGAVIDRKSDPNFIKGLDGHVAGLQHNTTTSMPGQYGPVCIRGLGSLASASRPLYVVDGIPVNSDAEGLYSSTNNYFDPLAAYNPADIASVTVLKDAAATAIYGSRAANGVIVITTRKGAESRFTMTLDVKAGFSKEANNNMDFADAWQTLDLFARGYSDRYSSYTYERAYELLKQRFNWDGEHTYDWQDAVTRTGSYQDYNLSFGGTSGTTNFYGSLGYLDAEGIIIGSDDRRYSGRLNLDTTWEWLTVGLNASYSYSVNNTFSQSISGTKSSPTVAAIGRTPMEAFYTAEGEYAGIDSYNPLAICDKHFGDIDEINNQTINANPWLRLQLPHGLWVKTNFGANIVDQREYAYWSALYNPQGMQYNGKGQQSNYRSSTITWTNTLGWKYTFSRLHSADVLLGQEMQRYEYRREYYSGYDFPFAASGMRTLASAGAWDDSSYDKASSRLASYFANLHYSYDSRYYLSLSGRRDGSSVFGARHRWGNFWSAGAKWRLSQERFLAGNRAVTNAALRLSYGTVGNQSLPSLYAARAYYSAGYNYNQTPGMVPANIENPDLTWETSRKFDAGLDLSLFNRAHLTVDFYTETTTDALYNVPVSMVTGQDSYYKNVGRLRNSGIEIAANGTLYTSRDFDISAFLTLTSNRNRVLRLADGPIDYSYMTVEEGRPYRTFYMKEWAGVDRTDGRPLWYLNPTGTETTGDYNAAARRYLGSSEPKVYGALGLTARGYGVDFSMQFNYRLGGKVYHSAARLNGWGMSWRSTLLTIAQDSWTPDNPDATNPRYLYNDPDLSCQHSSRFLMPGDFVRLSNLTLGYTLPEALTRRVHISKLRVYTILDNLHTWTRSGFRGYNPDTYANGIIAYQYPAVFTFTAGLQITI